MPDTVHLLHRHRQLAPTASIRVSPLCLGAMTFGEAQKDWYGECSRGDSFAILDHFWSSGGNFIDTANAYQFGQSEQWLGEWMKLRENRDQLVLSTKYTAPYKLAGDSKIRSNYGGNGTKSMRLSLEASLRRLQTAYVDLFYVHWWDFTASVPELMHNLNDLCACGKVFYLGISDAPAWVVTKANQYARDHGLRQFVVYQGMWNAAMRDMEREIIPMCRDEGMGLCPYGVLNQGRFQTKAGYEDRKRYNPGRQLILISQRDKDVAAVLDAVAESKGVKLLDVALSYVMHKAPYIFPIVGARTVEHIKGSMAALSVRLSTEEIAQIEGAYDFDPGFPHTFLSGSLFDGSTPRGASQPGDIWMTKWTGEFDWVDAPKPIEVQQKN